jgi:hypothetical protein
MNTDKHGLRKQAKRNSSSKVRFTLPPEPTLSKKEQVEVDKAWKIELRRRLENFRAGKDKEVSHDKVMREAYRALGYKMPKRKLTKNH